jgi:hypothetical protein
MSVPVPQWQTIRCIHISTVFEAIGASQELPVLFPPDNIDPWTECCEALAGLSRLRYLHFDIIARNGTRDPHSRLELFIEMLFIAILRPLKAMKAKDFQVELNVDVPQSIKNSLGVTPFILHTKERPYNHFVFMERVENVLGVIS